ncbi:MAG: hypothetical protein CMJ85_05865 [Planctomycetes bacterium]|jgi:hypothetical protein|nr:hypothetical protein [Planctomycetota bacterium]
MRPWALALLFLLPACREREDAPAPYFLAETENGGAPTGVLVEKRADVDLSVMRDASQAPIAIVVERKDSLDGQIGTHWLAVESDASVRAKATGVLVRSPALPQGSRLLATGTRVFEKPDAATVLRLVEPSSRTLHVAAWGNAIAVTGLTTLTVHVAGMPPKSFSDGAQLHAEGRSWIVLTSRGERKPIVLPAAKGPESQMTFVPERGAVRFFEPHGNVSAELPVAGLEVQDGRHGLLIVGRFDRGVVSVSDRSFSVFLPLRSHRLLVLVD